jgi:hypothetical protein
VYGVTRCQVLISNQFWGKNHEFMCSTGKGIRRIPSIKNSFSCHRAFIHFIILRFVESIERKERERKKEHESFFIAGKSTDAEHHHSPSSRTKNYENLFDFDLSTAHDAMEIPFECLKNRSKEGKSEYIS